MVKTIIDDIIIVSDEVGKIHRMEKMIVPEELEEYLEDVQKILTAKTGKPVVFPVGNVSLKMIEYLRENEQMSAMVRLDFGPGQVFYSFGKMDENAHPESPGYNENGFFVYEKQGVFFFPGL